jgi:hypothetical protein
MRQTIALKLDMLGSNARIPHRRCHPSLINTQLQVGVSIRHGISQPLQRFLSPSSFGAWGSPFLA